MWTRRRQAANLVIPFGYRDNSVQSMDFLTVNDAHNVAGKNPEVNGSASVLHRKKNDADSF
jgi:hypothetical protein